MLNLIDKFLNGITMYRLVLYYMIALLLVGAILSAFGLLPFSFPALIMSVFVITVVCWITNTIFAKVFKVPVNVESAYITALILALIISPPVLFDRTGLWFLIWVSVWAMASKYIFAVNRKHIFNPAALAVALMAVTINQAASWWVATMVMLPFVLVGGILITRKIHRFDLVLSFLAVATVTILFGANQNNLMSVLGKTVIQSPMLFLAFVMLTEPLTTPPTRSLRIMYGALVGFLFSPFIHIGSVYSTPELALLAGNIFAYLVSPKERLVLKLKEKIVYGKDICDFIFTPSPGIKFQAGQYLEWTLGHKDPDSRGNRRYFTIASAPTEKEIHLGVKFYPEPSTFKQTLLKMKKGDRILASQLAGDFVLPRNKNQKLVFIAGGIGITPYRSMIKNLLDTNEARSIVLFYSNRALSEIAYKDVFDQAEQKFGMKTIYTLTDANACPVDWKGCRGYIDANMIAQEVPDYKERTFYISGSNAMVVTFKKTLKEMGVARHNIRVDFFPGF